MEWQEILKKVPDKCPNCGGEIKNYIDDPMDDAEPRCEIAVKNKWKGKYSNCYPVYSPDFKLEKNTKPDFIDIDGDGDKEEPMKDAVKDKKGDKDE
jgi:hypothetical protein